MYNDFIGVIYETKFNRSSKTPEVEIFLKNISASGEIYIEFNQELIVPPFTLWDYYEVPEVPKPQYEWEGQGYATSEDWAHDSIMGYLNAQSN